MAQLPAPMMSLRSAVSNLMNSKFALEPLSRLSKYLSQQPKWNCRFHAKAFLLLFVLRSFAGCESTVSTRFTEESLARMPVILSPGDVLKISFPGAIELTQSQTIQADGKINLPYVGEVDAAGRTIGDLQRRLEALYKSQLQNTTVVVTLETSVTPVVIGGAVKKAGKYAFDRPTTVLQAIMEAGGADQFGTLGKVSVIRLVNGQQRTQVIDLRPILQGRPTKPMYVHTGDIIIVGESAF
jgi:protein involved in polysaccharide export with SLBB domain